jgi:hypothetical protein
LFTAGLARSGGGRGPFPNFIEVVGAGSQHALAGLRANGTVEVWGRVCAQCLPRFSSSSSNSRVVA